MGSDALRSFSIWLIVCAIVFIENGKAEIKEICNGEDHAISCEDTAVVVMELAEFGRREMERCITKEEQFMGCWTNVLPLLNSWCSGRQTCDISLPNPQLVEENNASPNACLDYLVMYLKVEYHCTTVERECSGGTGELSKDEGILSSHVTDQTGCGSSRSPWKISMSQGKTINLTLFDFAGDSQGQGQNYVTCKYIYGYIIERSLGINHTICGGQGLQKAIYSSKTNSVEVHLTARRGKAEPQFLIKYAAVGCAELSRPENAWYKRDGSEAVIGCETNDQEWRLTCTENTWHGSVGNCSTKVVHDVEATEARPESEIGFTSMIVMTSIACGVVVAVVIAVMCGVIYIKKYRMKQDTKRIQTTYATMEKHQTYYRPVNENSSNCNPPATDAPSERLVDVPGTWVHSDTFGRQGTMTSYPDQCMCPTLPGARA